jgi:hypothetical protein
MLGTSDLVTNLSYVFFGYRLQFLEEFARAQDAEKVRKTLGPEPWSVLNEILEVAGFPYTVSAPRDHTILKPYDLLLIDRKSGKELRTVHLSSGEAALMGIVGWLYSAQQHGIFPKLLLLDEPDARLHPSMTRQFLDIVNELLVGKYRIRVIRARTRHRRLPWLRRDLFLRCPGMRRVFGVLSRERRQSPF